MLKNFLEKSLDKKNFLEKSLDRNNIKYLEICI